MTGSKKKKCYHWLKKLEFPLIEVLTEMEANGVSIDTKALEEISIKVAGQAAILTEKIYDEAGDKFNIDSPKQLAVILFEKMQLPAVRKNKTGYSTDVQTLEELSGYPIANLVLEYRQLAKLKSTYIDSLPKLVNPRTKRIHTTFNQTIVSTGRLSSTDPNLQNIPVRSSLGKEIRRAFVPQNSDWLILSADYSQIELRIMAHFSGDDGLIDAFQKGMDIHSATAAVLENCTIDEVTPDMRRAAKAVNFGLLYGLGSFGLAQQLSISRSAAQTIINNYFEKYPGIKTYMTNTIEQVQRNGYVETLCGRRRYFLNINSRNHTLRTAEERAAVNMPVQGTASDMLKIAMIAISKEMKARRMKSLLTLQVHDELVFEVCPDELDNLRTIVRNEMENALPLGRVPIIADIGIGKNWFEAH